MTTATDHRRSLTVVGVDGSVSARNAVRWAATGAAGRDTTLLLVYAGVDMDTRAGALDAHSGTASGTRARARARSALAEPLRCRSWPTAPVSRP
ncbi:MAG: universal stress protein [Rhodococcus sp. (in: high G+C Gram-positive bacteria)]